MWESQAKFTLDYRTKGMTKINNSVSWTYWNTKRTVSKFVYINFVYKLKIIQIWFYNNGIMILIIMWWIIKMCCFIVCILHSSLILIQYKNSSCNTMSQLSPNISPTGDLEAELLHWKQEEKQFCSTSTVYGNCQINAHILSKDS